MKTSTMIEGLKKQLTPEKMKELRKMNELFLQRTFSLDATEYANRRVLDVLKSFDRTRSLEFLSLVRRRYFDRDMDGNRAFDAYYVDDVEAIMSKCLAVLRNEIDDYLYPEGTPKPPNITDSKRFKEINKKKEYSEKCVISAAKEGYSHDIDIMLQMGLERYLQIENQESKDRIREKMFEIFLTPTPYESFVELVHSEKKVDVDEQELQQIIGMFQTFWDKEPDNSKREVRGPEKSQKTIRAKNRVALNRPDFVRCSFYKTVFTTIEQAIKDFNFDSIANPKTIDALRTDNLEDRAYIEEKDEKRTDIRYLIRFVEGLSISDQEKRDLLCFYGAKNNDVVSSYIAQLLGVSDTTAVGIKGRIEQNPQIKGNLRKFEFISMDRAAEEMAMVIQKKRLELLFGDAIQREDSDGFFLYRAGSFDEQAESIKARDLESRKTVGTHVGYGSSSPEYQTPFLSTTMDPYIAATYMYAHQKTNPDKVAIKNPREQIMIIDCKVLYDIINKRIEYLHTDTSKHMPFEQELLRELLEVVDNPEYRKRIEERQREISEYPQYQSDVNLSTMIHPTFLEQVNDEEFGTLRDLIEHSAAYSLKEIGEDRVRKIEDYGRPSFEVTIKSAIPVRYTSTVEPGVTRQVTHEIDPLQFDFIQVLKDLRPDENGDTQKLTDFIRINQKTPMIERLSEIIESTMTDPESSVLNKVEAQFARMYYLEREPISKIMEKFSKKGIKFEDEQSQIALSEEMREQILGKLVRDPVMSATLGMCGIKTFPTEEKMQKVIGYGISRTVKKEEIKLEQIEQTAVQSVEEQKEVYLGYFDSKKRDIRCEAVKAAKKLLETVNKLKDIEI